MDYGKFKYQQKKRLAKQHTHHSKLKEVWFRPKTGDHDLLVKINKAREFLIAKDKVLVSVKFKGRELAHIDEGEKVMAQVLAALEDIGKLEAPAKRADKRIVCTLAPK
jgi:translation initiation factor IF-3